MKYYFAPLEGITDSIYRKVRSEFFNDITKYYTPFISPTSQAHFTNRELKDIAAHTGYECVPQVLTRDIEGFITAANMLLDLGYKEVNLNLGCPSGTVTGKGKGSALLRDLNYLRSFLNGIYSRSPLPVSIKTRIGFDNYDNWDELIMLFNEYPVYELTVHPRTRREFYKGAIHEDAFALAYKKSNNPLIYNGDLFTKDAISEKLENFSNLNGLMLGRGLVANPCLLSGSYDLNKVMSFHDTLLQAYINDRPLNAALGHMSEIMFYMSSCFIDSKRYLKKIQKARLENDYSTAVQDMISNCEITTSIELF